MLFDLMAESLNKLSFVKTSDGLGGFTKTTTKTAFTGTVAKSSGSLYQLAQKDTYKADFVLTVHKDVTLSKFDIIERADGTILRIISAPNQSPSCASFSFKSYDCETWEEDL